RVLLLIIIISAIMHFNENYIATSFVICVFGLTFLLIGQPSIIVFKDRFEHEYSTVLTWFGFKRIYYYADINSISIKGIHTHTIDATLNALNIIPKVSIQHYRINNNKIELVLKNGESKTISTGIYRSELEKAVKLILNELNQAR